MKTQLTALVCAVAACAAAAEAATTRTYYVAAEEVDWDYAPEGRDLMMGHDFTEDEEVFVKPGPHRIGHVYRKIRYVGYTDATFTTPLPVEDPSLGILGPVIRAEVGDEIDVVFENHSTMPVSIHPHGVFYDKASEGAMTNDSTSGDGKADDRVAPGAGLTYHWSVPERAGPGPNDPSSVVWLYHSHVDETRDTNTGLVGPMVITAVGQANPDGTPKDVDREYFSLFTVMDENQSLFLDDMVEGLGDSAVTEDAEHSETDIVAENDEEEFAESNLMHSINGYVYGSMPMPQMTVGEKVRWYVMALGTEVDLHTPHWHGNTVLVGGHRKDVVELMPATTLVADMEPDNPGIWMYHCHVNDHLQAGMTGRYEVVAAK
ncbi:MAG: multicopper oxidase domain-containing protein [Paracoccaceae bacterium]